MDFLSTITLTSDLKVFSDYKKKNLTSYGVGGSVKYFSEPTTFNQFRLLVDFANSLSLRFKVLGNGTNVLISDKGFDGLIISTKKLSDLFYKNGKIFCASGVPLSKMVNFLLNENFTGFEGLNGIPATVGGALVMNAGAFGYTISDYLLTVDLLVDGKLHRVDRSDCKFTYRDSQFRKENQVILSAEFDFPKGDSKEKSLELIKNFDRARTCSQPRGKCCGSVFKNPNLSFAGKLIEQAGLKGFRMGGAYVSLTHSNFILTDKNATATDVYNLIKFIKTTVKNKFNVLLSEEIEFIGDF